MHKIKMRKFPKIEQTDKKFGCIPANIENVLKYYGNNSFTEADILQLYDNKVIKGLSFPIIERDFAKFIPNFLFKFKSCNGSLDTLKNYLKSNIKKKIPVLISIKANFNPNCSHVVSVVGFDKKMFVYFDSGDGQTHEVNYNNFDFENLLQNGDYHTLIIKKR